MEIHELNTFSGTLGSGDYFATDNGNDTSKVSAESMFAPLNARIDNIIAGPAPSAEEIIDARLGADGVTYPSLGEAIRGQATDLENGIAGMSENVGRNLFNPDQLLKADGWTKNGEEYTGRIGDLVDAFSTSQVGLTIDGGFKADTQYTARVTFKTSGTVPTGNLIYLEAIYTDSTSTKFIYFDNRSDWREAVNSTKANATISKIIIAYSNSASANATLEIKNIQVSESANRYAYEPYARSAIDIVARNALTSMQNAETQLDVKFRRGLLNSNGVISKENSWCTLLPPFVTRIVLAEGAKAQFIFFNGTTYLGKMNILGELDSSSGNWSDLTGEIDIAELYTKYGATHAYVGHPDSSLTTDALAMEYAKANVSVYAPYGCDWYDYVPSYFESQLSTVIANVKNDIGRAGKNGYSFIFTTDNHWNKNDGHSPALIKAVQNATKIQDVVLGGDLIDGSADKAHELELLHSVADKFYDPQWMRRFCFGNHDSNTVGQTSSPELHFSNGEVYMATQKNQDYEVVFSDDGFVDYHYDVPANKTRIIVVDSKIEGIDLYTSQLNWLNTTLESTPNDYKIIVIMHIFYGTDTIATQGQQVFDTVDAFNTRSTGAKVVALFGGHAHRDANYVTPGGIPLTLTNCDFPLTSVVGDINSQVVDVITVDYTNEVINCRRIGRGSDRTFAL